MAWSILSMAALPAGASGDAGWWAWWTRLYQTDRLWFTLVTIGVLVVAGAALGALTDAVMRRLGVDLDSRRDSG